MPLKSKKVDEGEVTKNAQLAEALREPLVVAGVSTVLCQPVRRPDRRHPDILIANDDGQEVVVECKQDDPQLARAKADAMGRLATGDKIIGLAAVSYNGSESASNLNWAFRAAKAPDWEGVIRGSNDLELRLRIEQAFFPKRLEVGQSIARIHAAVDQFTATCANMPGVADGLAKALKVDYKRAGGRRQAGETAPRNAGGRRAGADAGDDFSPPAGAGQLGMMSPTVQFKHCGVRAVDMRADGERGPVLGSLQWLNEENLFKLIPSGTRKK